MTAVLDVSGKAGRIAEAFYDPDYTARLEQERSTLRLRIAVHFQPFIEPTDRILDFGCGPGFLLESLTAATEKNAAWKYPKLPGTLPAARDLTSDPHWTHFQASSLTD